MFFLSQLNIEKNAERLQKGFFIWDSEFCNALRLKQPKCFLAQANFSF